MEELPRMRESVAGTLTLVVCSVAGLVDLVALPLWVGALIGSRGYGPAGAGLLVTCYLLGVLGSSLAVAPRFHLVSGRLTAAAGFAVAAFALVGMVWGQSPAALAALHLLGGLGAGAGLSATHGTIGCTANPHRVFGWALLGTGLFAIVFFAVAPGVIAAHGADGLFVLLGAVLLIASVAAALVFPSVVSRTVQTRPDARSGASLLAFLAVSCLAITESMVFSTAQSIGLQRGFTVAQIGAVLLVGGFVNLTASLAAILLQRRVPPFLASTVAIGLHGIMAALVTVLGALVPWGAALVAMVWLILFGHNFIFGVIAQVDPSGRTTASTPAMLMTGAAIGPALGGMLAQAFGYGSLGVAALLFATAGTALFLTLGRQNRRTAMLELPS